MKEVTLVPATTADYATICNLARFYAYDISEFYGDDPEWGVTEDGMYDSEIDFKKYFEDSNASLSLIRYKGKLAGFIIIDKNSIDPTGEFNMAQFFIVRTYKGRGLGKYCAFHYFRKFMGLWEINVLPKNESAYKFWRSIIAEYTNNNFSEKTLKNKNGKERIIFHFSTK